MKPMNAKKFFSAIRPNGPHNHTVDASELGLAPGEWPYEFHVEDFGVYYRDMVHRFHGEVGHVTYKMRTSFSTLTIYND